MEGLVVSSPLPPSLFVYREALQRKADEHIRAAVDIRIHLNSLLPITRLPAEIMAMVFYLHMSSVSAEVRADEDVCPWSWLPQVMHVCARWRDIAMQTPFLWSEITVGPGNTQGSAVRMSLRLSKEVPLHVRVLSPPHVYVDPKVWDTILHQIYRAKTLQLANLSDLKTHTLPTSLTRLVIGTSSSRYKDIADPSYSPSHMAKAIRHLCSLQYMDLHCIFDIMSPNITVMPKPKTIVEFPALRSIHITSSYLSCAHFLDHLMFPDTTEIRVTTFRKPFPPPLIWSLAASSLASKVTAALAGGARVVSRVALANQSFMLYVATSKTSQEALRLFLTVQDGPDARFLSPFLILGEILPSLPVRDASKLLIRNVLAPLDRKANWVASLDAMPNIDTLTVVGDSPGVDGVVHILTWKNNLMDKPSPTARKIYVLPALERIQLSGLDFDKEPHQMDSEFEFYEDFEDAILARRTAGCRPKLLAIKNCTNVSVDGIHLLRKVKGFDVWWDAESEAPQD